MTAFVIDEHIRPDSTVERTALAARGGELALVIDLVERGRVTELALVVVLRRYGRPLDRAVAAELAAAPRLALSGGRALARLHWRAAVDAGARDWLVLCEPGAEPLAALSPTIGAALRHLAGVKAG
ncbi:MAG: hypothetical protein IPL61_01465 [Myxococcales bacterium]|nr:hypothetical protein [Myxococcales bacterium]